MMSEWKVVNVILMFFEKMRASSNHSRNKKKSVFISREAFFFNFILAHNFCEKIVNPLPYNCISYNACMSNINTITR